MKRDKWLITMCWLLYTAAYLGRYSYSTNLLPLSLHYGQSEDSVALATTFFFFAYGAGAEKFDGVVENAELSKMISDYIK